MTLLQVRAVSKAYGGVQALRDCSASFAQGAINGLIGPNGSGKTTLFNVMTGYERSDGGTVTFAGRDISALSPRRIFALGIARTFQQTRVFPRLTVLENVHIAMHRANFGSRARHWTTAAEEDRAMEPLDLMGLTALRRELVGNLSYGQQKLVELASVLVAKPAVILLDEPAGGINPTLMRRLSERIRQLNADGVTFVIVEHDMEFVMRLCDQVSVMHQGATLAAGTPAAIREDAAVMDAYLGGELAGEE